MGEVDIGIGRTRARALAQLFGVQRCQILHDDAERPAVADDVVRSEDQQVLVRCQAQQLGAHEWAVFEVERMVHNLVECGLHLALARCLAERGEVAQRARKLELRGDMQLFAILAQRRSQYFMTFDERLQAGLQRGDIERSGQVQRYRFVIGQRCLGLQLGCQPDLALRFGGGNHMGQWRIGKRVVIDGRGDPRDVI